MIQPTPEPDGQKMNVPHQPKHFPQPGVTPKVSQPAPEREEVGPWVEITEAVSGLSPISKNGRAIKRLRMAESAPQIDKTYPEVSTTVDKLADQLAELHATVQWVTKDVAGRLAHLEQMVRRIKEGVT
jgi:hypothetical protein